MSVNLMKAAVLSKLIGEIGTVGVKRDAMINQACHQCIGYSIKDSNITPAKQLYEAVGKSARRDALVAFLEKHGNMKWDAKEGFVFHRVEDRVWDQKYAASLDELFWFNATPEAKIKSMYDADKDISGVLDRLSKQANKPGVEVKNKALLNHMIAAYNRFSFEEFGRKATADVTDIEAEQKEADQDEANAANADPAKLVELQAKFAPLAQAA